MRPDTPMADTRTSRASAPPCDSERADDTVCLLVNQLIARLREAGETLETVNRNIAVPQDSKGNSKLPNSPAKPSVMELLQEANNLAADIGAEAHSIASKIG